jgi:ABC-type antimicrobial peptide transport system permease subunit
VLPSSKTNKLGYGAVVSFKTLKRLDPSVPNAVDEIQLAPGAAGAAATKRLNSTFDLSLVIRPGEVGDFGRIDNMPLYIALVFTGGAAAALAHALASSVRRRRRHLAILKTLGFTRAQVAGAVAWQATTIAAVAALVGVPLGIGVGRFAWDVFATDLGVEPEAVVPVVACLLVLPVAVLMANLIAVGPGWAAARVRPARVLRVE